MLFSVLMQDDNLVNSSMEPSKISTCQCLTNNVITIYNILSFTIYKSINIEPFLVMGNLCISCDDHVKQ